MNVLATMAAIAIAFGISSAGEAWESVENEPVPSVVAAVVTVDEEVETVETVEAIETADDAACVVVPIYRTIVETVDGTDEWIHTQHSDWAFSGDWSSYKVQADVVGSFLVIGIDQPSVDSFDMDLQSIDVAELDEVTICQ